MSASLTEVLSGSGVRIPVVVTTPALTQRTCNTIERTCQLLLCRDINVVGGSTKMVEAMGPWDSHMFPGSFLTGLVRAFTSESQDGMTMG